MDAPLPPLSRYTLQAICVAVLVLWPVWVDDVLTFKPEVVTEQPLSKILLVAERVYDKHGYDCVITSLNDSRHMIGSAHYRDRAADLRTRHLRRADIPVMLDEMQHALGPLYHILYEGEVKDANGRVTRGEHIHAQFGQKAAQPEHKETT